MLSLRETLKSVENSVKAGYKNGAWFPHKSAEGGTRTLAYGHKLSQKEDDGNYVKLPNGDIVDFSQRGLTEQEAEMLLDDDISTHRQVAAKQWNDTQDVDFDSLSPIHQAVLSEIAFNLGTLRNKKGGWGWPSLAKGIKNDDPEVIKKEMMRSYTDPEGKRHQLVSRVNSLRAVVDAYYTDPTSVSLEGFTLAEQPVQTAPTTASVNLPTGFPEQFIAMMGEVVKASQSSSQEVSEPVTADTEERLGESEDAAAERGAVSQFTEAEEALISAAVSTPMEDKPAEEEVEWTLAEQNLLERATGTVETAPPVYAETREMGDDSKDPIYGIF